MQPDAVNTQPWKAVWPPTQGAVAPSAPQNLSSEEMANQRAFGSHASNTKGRIVHLTKSDCEYLFPPLSVSQPALDGTEYQPPP